MKKFKIGAIVACAATALVSAVLLISHWVSKTCDFCEDGDSECDCSK